MTDQHGQMFMEEASELLAELETSLLELEAEPDDIESIGRVFRAMHTLKGLSGMFGFEDITRFTHEIESIFDMVRNSDACISKELIDLTLTARDQIKAMILADGSEDSQFRDENAGIVAALQELVGSGEGKYQELSSIIPMVKDLREFCEVMTKHELARLNINVRKHNRIYLVGMSCPLEEIQLDIAAMSERIKSVGELLTTKPEPLSGCDTIGMKLLFASAVNAAGLEETLGVMPQEICLAPPTAGDGSSPVPSPGTASPGRLDMAPDVKKLGEILVERGDLQQEELEKVLAGRKLIGEMLIDAELVSPGQVYSALVEQQHAKELARERLEHESATSIRVAADKLDILVNLVSELVTVQARLSQAVARQKDNSLISVAEEVERLTGELRDNALSIRMVPIGSAFGKFKRLVHDLAGELGKEVELVTSGEETELDKTVIENLNEPFVHLIRNCIDHGIEMPEQRVAAGKTRKGVVHLAAVHSGDSVLITISDDGAGLDKAAIREKAVEKGLIPSSGEVSDHELFAQIFAPGFSTAKRVSDVSGRGVGMDVVKRAIESLRGSIELNSSSDEGTRITIKLPLTLAIVESLLVKVAGDCFVLPLSSVEECIELQRKDETRGRENLANVRGGIVPYIPLREMFGIRGEVPPVEQIVITEVENMRVGLVVDSVVGEHQSVIKSLGRVYRNMRGFSGATILGDGSVALILDVPQLVRSMERNGGGFPMQ